MALGLLVGPWGSVSGTMGESMPKAAACVSLCVCYWDHRGVDAEGRGVCVVVCVLLGP